MKLGLEGKHAFVAGASAGLGLAVARELAAEGAEVIINSRSESNLSAAADTIEKATGVRPKAAVGDLSTVGGRASVIESILGLAGGAVDIVVANTGGPPPGQFLDHDPDVFESAGKLVLDSAVAVTRAFLPGMIERKWGRLIYITSVGVLQPIDTLILSQHVSRGRDRLLQDDLEQLRPAGYHRQLRLPGLHRH